MTRLLAALALCLAPLVARAQEFETAATAAYVYDMTTRTVLYEKNADEPLPPASKAKLMTLYVTFEALRDGLLTLDTTLPVSEAAMSYDGSSMFLNTMDRPTVEDLLRGIVVLSGNDATVVLAEALSPDGTEAGFARMLTERGRQMGMTNSIFLNSNGWPAEGMVMSMRDLGLLAERLILDFPEYYPLFAEQEFLYDGRVPSNTQNRNPILGLGIGADGLKTGFSEEAGYGLVGSALQGDRRIIFVVTGLTSVEARRTESERIVNWAFRQFALREVARAGTRLAEAEVWMGAQPTVGIVLPEDLSVLVPTLGEGLEATVSYRGPLAAPIEAGQEVAELVLTRPGLPEMRLPLVAEASVPAGGFRPRLETALGVLLAKAGLARTAAAPAAEEPAAAEPVPADGDGA